MRTALQRVGTPVGTMALWCAFYIAITVVQAMRAPVEQADWLTFVVVDLAIIATLLAWGARTPAWLLKAFVLVQMAVILVATARAPTPVAMLAEATGSVIAVLYSAVWWRGWFTYAVAAIASVGYLVSIHLAGMVDALAETWYLLTVMLVGIAFGLNLVVGEVTRAATHDPLTGLLNRNGLSQAFRIHPRPGRATLPRTVISIDLDGLKSVNDAGGHQAGDRLLKDFAAVLRDGLRSDDLAVRVGGDEFLVILAQTAPADTGTLVSRLREQSPGPWSCGVTEWLPDEPFDTAMLRADALLYEDKRFRRGLAAR